MAMDNSLAALYRELEAADISVVDLPLKGSACLSLSKGRVVGIDRTRLPTEAQQRTALIHEQGHFDSGAFYTPFSPYQLRAQAEDRANRSAYLRHVPPQELRKQLQKGLSVWELADYFNVTDEFIWKSYLFYRDTLGLSFDGSGQGDAAGCPGGSGAV